MLMAGLVQQKCTSNIENNRKLLKTNAEQLAQMGANIIVFQELHNSLYFCQAEDIAMFELAEPIPGPSTGYYGKLAKELNVVLVTSLFEKRAPGLYHNTAVVFDKDGSIAGTYRKMHIPDDPGFYEKYYFAPGDKGFLPIKTSIGKLGVLVCWDQWYPEAARLMALAGAELLIYPTAIGWYPPDNADEKKRQQSAWITIQRSHAIANGVPVIAVNRVGNESLEGEAGIDFWGSSFVAGPQGEILAQASSSNEENMIVPINLGNSEIVRQTWPFFRDRRIDDYTELTKRYIDKS
ncbi:MAG: carbon-nitrogen hydrolase [Spirochaetes bacterium]|nr:carbon-nitrogen hydrolase [Spirochaetota bacterium]MBN2769538.1 carbon-nitrogen hydrolase [Spirochaetota bacterium]